MNVSKSALFILATIFLSPSLSWGWSLHALVTDLALKGPRFSCLEKEIAVEPLESFLASQSAPLAKLYGDYYDWLRQSGRHRFHKMEFHSNDVTIDNFLMASRLNPGTKFQYVNRVLPGQSLKYPNVISTLILPKEEMQKSFRFQFESTVQKSVSAKSILATYSDEPDWGMDRSLWSIPKYGYGKIPFGSEIGVASQAPFHMQFMHENFLLRIFAPSILDGMASERVELFSRLSKLAFESGHPYWGYRFLSWSLHYVEDLGQPYHSRAVPFADATYYLKFIFSRDKEKIKSETTQLVKNRHFLFEDFVGYALQESYTNKKPLYEELASSLRSGVDLYNGIQSVQDIVQRVAKNSANHAFDIDYAVSKSFDPRQTEDPTLDLETDPHYDIGRMTLEMNANQQARLLSAAKVDLANTAMAARSLILLLIPDKECKNREKAN